MAVTCRDARMGAGFGPSFVAALAVAYAEFEPNLAKYALDSNSVLNKLWSGNLQHLENNGRAVVREP